MKADGHKKLQGKLKRKITENGRRSQGSESVFNGESVGGRESGSADKIRKVEISRTSIGRTAAFATSVVPCSSKTPATNVSDGNPLSTQNKSQSSVSAAPASSYSEFMARIVAGK